MAETMSDSQEPSSEASGSGYEARPYQLELLDAAIEENTIVNLGTGAGKTFIAVMLIRELCSPILLPFEEDKAKRTVFLVTTVPLVDQQAGYIEKHTSFKVGRFIGEMGVDFWPRAEWLRQFQKYQVLVMTATIFKNIVMQAMLPLKKVNLVIFDECHHAVKNHEYVQIMKLFEPHIKQGDEVPRVLGLTASLIPSKCKPGELQLKIEELEKILTCRSQTADDLVAVSKYATNPEEVLIRHRSGDLDPSIARLKLELEGCLEFLQLANRKVKETDIYSFVKLYLDDLMHLLENLGVWCANKFAKEAIELFNQEITERGSVHYASEWEKSLLSLGRTRLKVFLELSARELSSGLECPTTDKIAQLLHFLSTRSTHIIKKDPSLKLLGIVFVERRTTAVMLSRLINHLQQSHPGLHHIRCDYVVGHSEGRQGTILRKEASMNFKKQSAVLKSFRKENINLLISTSVVEEGVDVPKCNTVIRFDFPQNLRAYVQSKGRARAKISQYVLFIDSKNEGKQLFDLQNYRSQEKELETFCRGRHVPESEEIIERMEELVPPYMPEGKDGPIATISSSLSLIYKYCQKLPKDRYTVLTPDFHTVEIDSPDLEPLYQTTLTLPMSCPLRDPVQGLPMPGSREAEKAAAFEAVKELYRKGELDKHFRPFVRDTDSDEEDEEKMALKNIHNKGTSKKSDYYPNKVASSLTDCHPVPGAGNYLYLLMIREAKEHAPLYQHLSPGAPANTFGIITSKPIPYLRVPKFSLYDEDTVLNVEIVPHSCPELSPEELEKLRVSHQLLFSEMLRLTPDLLQFKNDFVKKSYLVVPLCLLEYDSLFVFLDMELVDTIAKLKSEQSKQWPLEINEYYNGLVTDYREHKLYEVRSIDPTQTPCSPFPDFIVAPTFLDYFKSRYGFQFNDLQQPALVLKHTGLSEKHFKMLHSRYKDVKKQISEIVLFPEQCALYPVPANVWKLARCLPSLLWRLECFLSVEDFRAKVAAETGIGRGGDGVEITTDGQLICYEDNGFGDILTQKFTTIGCTTTRQPLSTRDPSILSQRGPDNALLLQAFTSKGAGDAIDLERLETLGDSFLKLATSVFLFNDRAAALEGTLSSARSRRVGNFNLYYNANRDNVKITEHILSTSFDPRQMWVPPCYSCSDITEGNDPALVQKRYYLKHKATDKGVADCVEALIGAYLVAGGIDAGLRFMKWVGIKIVPETPEQNFCQPLSEDLTMYTNTCSQSSVESGEITGSCSSSPQSQDSFCLPKLKKVCIDHSLCIESMSLSEEHSLPLFISNSSPVFLKHFAPQPVSPPDDHERVEVEKFLEQSHGGNQKLIEFFECISDRVLLLQALTHASYSKNRVTDCYQRLEFLGDAVLDYLVTCHIYSTFPEYKPGDISMMRSALVNNNTFAELSVELELHRAVLHSSPTLFKQIGDFVDSLNDSHEDKEQENLIIRSSESKISPAPAQKEASPSEEEDIEELDPPKVLGDILESVAGAIFVDSGGSLEAVWRVFKPLFVRRIASFNGTIPIVPVSELLSRDSVTIEKAKLHGGKVRCTVTFKDKHGEMRKISARGKNFKAARITAAKAALKEMD